MKPAAFEFHAPDSEQEIQSLLEEHGDEARLLAGGQSLVPLMNMRILQPSVIISLNRCQSLAYLKADGDCIRCGALTRQADAEESKLVARHVPLLRAALPHVGVAASRNFGTVCGSLAHADPLAELPSVASALDATFVITSARGTREVDAGAFFVSALTTCVEPDEMLREVRFPKVARNARSVFLEVANRAHGSAVVALAACVELDAEKRCTRARLAAVAVGDIPFRLTEAETLLDNKALTKEVIDEAAMAAAGSVQPEDDAHASADHRRHLVAVLVKRALGEALAQEAPS
ncbi:MAG: xanthine dehydrogenase family protein subunit M [Gammaproteobacteria bacterium]|nr:MAG: xanthine dehydrogenase family protein subunit M [Gammaproteobacteria bacterium]